MRAANVSELAKKVKRVCFAHGHSSELANSISEMLRALARIATFDPTPSPIAPGAVLSRELATHSSTQRLSKKRPGSRAGDTRPRAAAAAAAAGSSLNSKLEFERELKRLAKTSTRVGVLLRGASTERKCECKTEATHTGDESPTRVTSKEDAFCPTSGIQGARSVAQGRSALEAQVKHATEALLKWTGKCGTQGTRALDVNRRAQALPRVVSPVDCGQVDCAFHLRAASRHHIRLWLFQVPESRDFLFDYVRRSAALHESSSKGYRAHHLPRLSSSCAGSTRGLSRELSAPQAGAKMQEWLVYGTQTQVRHFAALVSGCDRYKADHTLRVAPPAISFRRPFFSKTNADIVLSRSTQHATAGPAAFTAYDRALRVSFEPRAAVVACLDHIIACRRSNESYLSAISALDVERANEFFMKRDRTATVARVTAIVVPARTREQKGVAIAVADTFADAGFDADTGAGANTDAFVWVETNASTSQRLDADLKQCQANLDRAREEANDAFQLQLGKMEERKTASSALRAGNPLAAVELSKLDVRLERLKRFVGNSQARVTQCEDYVVAAHEALKQNDRIQEARARCLAECDRDLVMQRFSELRALETSEATRTGGLSDKCLWRTSSLRPLPEVGQLVARLDPFWAANTFMRRYARPTRESREVSDFVHLNSISQIGFELQHDPVQVELSPALPVALPFWDRCLANRLVGHECTDRSCVPLWTPGLTNLLCFDERDMHLFVHVSCPALPADLRKLVVSYCASNTPTCGSEVAGLFEEYRDRFLQPLAPYVPCACSLCAAFPAENVSLAHLLERRDRM